MYATTAKYGTVTLILNPLLSTHAHTHAHTHTNTSTHSHTHSHGHLHTLTHSEDQGCPPPILVKGFNYTTPDTCN